jgi:hypothetical protein
MKIFPQNTIEIQSKLNLKKRNRNTNIKSEMDSIKKCNVTLSQQMKENELFKEVLT